jgi:hypothetical protein
LKRKLNILLGFILSFTMFLSAVVPAFGNVATISEQNVIQELSEEYFQVPSQRNMEQLTEMLARTGLADGSFEELDLSDIGAAELAYIEEYTSVMSEPVGLQGFEVDELKQGGTVEIIVTLMEMPEIIQEFFGQ